ncbi:MAG TPA: YqgE/AlgH family protein [Rhodocyclaceae bacterium]|mgnify:FL=1|nr:YqgE/AlgH family protein [Rhodocyclaceae bacterium]
MAEVAHSVCLTHNFLIAMPAMSDPNFSRSLTYICEHNEQGALGIIINRPMNMDLATLFGRINISLEASSDATLGATPVYYGGPVQTDRGFVLHRPTGHWQSTLAIREDIGLTSTRDILQEIGAHGTPSEILVTLGYAGWSAGQLEWELSQNAWLNVSADPQIIFDLPPEERLAAAMHLLGVDFANLSDVAGHA